MRESIIIPYFDHNKNLLKTIKNSSTRRKMNPFYFAFRKMRNIILYNAAFMCPFNIIRVWLHKMRGVNIGVNVYIGQHCVIDNAYPEYIYIGDNVSLAGEVSLIAHSNPYKHFAPLLEAKVAPIIIKNGAWIGVKAVVLLGVEVGEKSIVSAATVVDKNVPDFTIVRGNPMKIISEYGYLYQ